MLKRLVSVVVTCILFFLATPAVAQEVAVMPAVQQSPADHLRSLIFNRAVPARVQEVHGPVQLEVGEEGLFTAAGNLETASLPVEGRWDFGDGTQRKGMTARHVFEKPGRYTVLFTLSNSVGDDVAAMQVEVVEKSVESARVTTERHR